MAKLIKKYDVVTVRFKTGDSLKGQLTERAKGEGISVEELVRRLLRKALDRTQQSSPNLVYSIIAEYRDTLGDLRELLGKLEKHLPAIQPRTQGEPGITAKKSTNNNNRKGLSINNSMPTGTPTGPNVNTAGGN